MKWIPIISKGKYTLLQSKSDTQYVVAANYNANAPENEQWSAGTYFCYFDAEWKLEEFQDALECFCYKTECGYITKARLEELCTRFKDKVIELLEEDGLTGEEIEYELERLGLEPYEMEWLGFPEDTDLQTGLVCQKD